MKRRRMKKRMVKKKTMMKMKDYLTENMFVHDSMQLVHSLLWCCLVQIRSNEHENVRSGLLVLVFAFAFALVLLSVDVGAVADVAVVLDYDEEEEWWRWGVYSSSDALT